MQRLERSSNTNDNSPIKLAKKPKYSKCCSCMYSALIHTLACFVILHNVVSHPCSNCILNPVEPLNPEKNDKVNKDASPHIE